MKSQSHGRNTRRPRQGGGSRRPDNRNRPYRSEPAVAREPVKLTFWQSIQQRVAALFNGGGTSKRRPERSATSNSAPARNGYSQSASVQPARTSRKPEEVEVTSARLYVGNLSFDASESDLFELFNGVGQVQNAEVVTYKHNQRSKGFAFVQMQSIEEAKRAVTELHDKDFLGRKLVVSGAKSSDHAPRD